MPITPSSIGSSGSVVAEQLRSELVTSQRERDAAKLRSVQLEAEVEALRAELDRQAVSQPSPNPSHMIELATAETQALQHTIDRELKSLDDMTARIEKAVVQRAAIRRGSPSGRRTSERGP